MGPAPEDSAGSAAWLPPPPTAEHAIPLCDDHDLPALQSLLFRLNNQVDEAPSAANPPTCVARACSACKKRILFAAETAAVVARRITCNSTTNNVTDAYLLRSLLRASHPV